MLIKIASQPELCKSYDEKIYQLLLNNWRVGDF